MGGCVRMSDIPDASVRQRLSQSFFTPEGALRNNKKLHDIMPSDIWKGRRCFIVGGGLSLQGFDFSKLRGELIIAVNRAMEYCPTAAIMVAQDARLWGWYEGGELGEDAKRKFQEFRGFKAWVNCQSFPYPEDVYVIDSTHERDFNWTNFNYSGGLPSCSNSGLNALCLAVCLGANPIYLLGFDMSGKNGHTINFHSGYPDKNEEAIYKDNFVPNFNDFSDPINKYTTVINLNPDSELKCFRFGRFEDIKPVKRPLVIGYYTVNTPYEQEIKKLESSLIKFGLEYHFEGVENLGSWHRNLHQKIEFILRCMDRFNMDLLYLDSDAVVQRYPALFDDFDEQYDMAAGYVDWGKYFKDKKREFKQLNGAILYLKNCEKMKDLMKEWEVENRNHFNDFDVLDQEILQELVERDETLKVFRLPDTYCQIFDLMASAGEPVIEMFQASRRFKERISRDFALPDQMALDEKHKYEGLWLSSYHPSQCAPLLSVYISKNAKKSERLIDLGCGDGLTVRLLRDMGYDCAGIDITSAGVNKEQPVKKKWFIEGCLWNMPIDDNQFDFTFSTDVLEHIPEERIDDVIREIFRITKDRTFHCIAVFDDIRLIEGKMENLHKIVRPIGWWIEKFNCYNKKGIKVEVLERGEFLLIGRE